MKNIYKQAALSTIVALGLLACSDSGSTTKPELDNQESSSSLVEDEVSSSSYEDSLQMLDSLGVASSSSEDVRVSSSSVDDVAESSSSIEDVAESSSSIEDVAESSSSETEISSSSEVVEVPLSDECIALRSTYDQFPQVTEILDCVRPSEKVVFVLRHAARDRNATNENDGLNDEGRAQSIELGQQLKDAEDIYFMYTDVHRTMETVLKIAEGKGQEFSESSVPFKAKVAEDHEENNDLKDGYLIKNKDKYNECRNKFSWSWSAFSHYAYEDDVYQECLDAFYDIDDRIQEFVDTYFTYERMHNITIAISHDKVMVPMAIAASQRQVDLRFHKHENDFNYWINYLTGIAIIVDKDDNVTLLPATAVEDAYLRVYPEN